MIAEVLCCYLMVAFVFLLPVYSSLEGYVTDDESRMGFAYIIAGGWIITCLVIVGFLFYSLIKDKV